MRRVKVKIPNHPNYINYDASAAIIERDNGKIEVVPAEYIQFMEKQL